MNISFEWDHNKDRLNQINHNVSFSDAREAFSDPKRVITRDRKHSGEEDRFYCIGKTDKGILTVRFTYRKDIIRIIGAGFWRKGKKIYESE
ncbi:MAG: hypothetical protein BWK80_26035 [Desulfobacteraceae bacterium IS3]|nr:MAG: hypothetical protein BWK80_26035 [Desulfobacteraceae bacterium IS3]HAO20618.1 hypothetical protein [Desulfobacteraceae bacterium]